MWDILIGTIFILACILTWKKLGNGNILPGPTGLPFIGSAFQLDPNGAHNTMCEWMQTYGNVYMFKMFGRDYVVLSKYENIHKSMVTHSDDFAGRPPMYRFDVMYNHTNSVVATSFTRKWIFMKKVATQSLKTYGDKRTELENIFLEHTGNMLDELESLASSGEPVDPFDIMNHCMTAIISSAVFGIKMDKKHIDGLRECEASFNVNISNNAGAGILLDVFPWLRYLPLRAYYAQLVEARNHVVAFIKEQIHEAKEKFVPGKPSSYIESVLNIQEESKKGNHEFILTDDDVYALTFDMLNAGTSTSSVIMHSLIAILTNHPEVQERMAQEVKLAIGERRVTLDDKQNLPYVEATIIELFRYHTLVPMNVPHQVVKEISIGGFVIPKGTNVLMNVWELQHDPDFWDEPWTFNPDRFLDEEGRVLPVDHPLRTRVMAFGAGRRHCLGEVFARNRLLLTVSSIVQHFVMKPIAEEQRPKHDPREYNSGFNLHPKPYKMIFQLRK